MKQVGSGWLPSAPLIFTDATAQQYACPAKGQTPEKQKSDESACRGWAVQQTSVDPAKTPQADLAGAQSTQQQQQAASSQQQVAFAKARAACLVRKASRSSEVHCKAPSEARTMTRTLRSRLQTALAGASLLTLGGCASRPDREARGMRLDTGAPQLLLNFSAALNDKLRVSNSPVMVTGSGTQKAPDDVRAAVDVAVAAAFSKHPIPAPPRAT